MKKLNKLTAVLLCVVLLLTLSVNVSAAECLQTETSYETKNVPITNGVTVNVDEINDEIIIEPIAPFDDEISLAATAATPIGHLDTVSSSVIGGWAYRRDIPNSPIEVHIYITNNSTSEQTVYTTVANKYRADLETAGYGNGYHSFHLEMNWLRFKPGTYTVRAYAIGANGNNPQLTNSPKTFTVRPMYGGVDGVGDYITGWVWKPDAPNSSVQAHVYIYRPNGEQVFVMGVNANRYRSDVQAAGYGTGNYGFACLVNWSSLPEERLTIKVYAVDGSSTHPMLYSGYYNNGNGTTPTPTPTTAYIWPTVSKRITQMYNSIPPYTTGHYGIDIGAVTANVAGDPIYCIMDGYVVRSEESDSYGWVVYINHINPNQSISTYVQTRYAHMTEQRLLVSKNTNVTKGTQVGYMDTTGWSDAVHLHFETRITPVYERLFSEDKSYCINPLTYYDSNGNVLAYNVNSNDSSGNPWGLIFDINDIEIDRYGEVEKIDIEKSISP